MKKTIWTLTLIAALAIWRPAESNPFHPSPPPLAPDAEARASDLSVDQLLAKAQAARGGEPKLKGIQSAKMTGTWMVLHSAANPHALSGGVQDSPSPITVMIAPGRYMRRIEQGTDVPMIKTVDGQTTWEVSPQRGIYKPTPMLAKDAERFRHLADPQGPLVNARAKGNKVEVIGTLAWKNLQVYKLKVTFRDGGVSYFYLDAKSFLPVRMVTNLYIPQSDKDIDIEFIYEDFRDVNGVKWPFTEKANAPEGNLSQVISWQTIEVNKPLDESAFKAPKS